MTREQIKEIRKKIDSDTDLYDNNSILKWLADQYYVERKECTYYVYEDINGDYIGNDNDDDTDDLIDKILKDADYDDIINSMAEDFGEEEEPETDEDEELKIYQMQVDQAMYDAQHEPTYDPENGSK